MTWLGLLLVSPVLAAPPSPAEMAASKEDVWAEAAIKAPGGPSYEFFKDLLPPVRYANTAFKHYPIVLSAPLSPVKARWISNGSGVNLLADKKPMWKEAGTPVAFFVGDKGEAFGADVQRLEGPTFTEGCLPVVQVFFKSDDVKYYQFAYALISDQFAEQGALFLKFAATKPGRVVARPDAKLQPANGTLRNEKGNIVLVYGPEWKWDADKSELHAKIGNSPVELLIFTKPLAKVPNEFPSFESMGRETLKSWTAILDKGSSLQIPELIVQNAWRSHIVGNFMIAAGDRMNYSAGNAYDHLYEAECGDAVRSLLLFGHIEDAKKMIGPLLDFDRKATRFHVAGQKLQLLADYYWRTRDKKFIEETRLKWEPVVKFIRDNRKTENGLLPKDNYAGDVNTQILSLNSNANCWRGLRDMAAVLEGIADGTNAARLAEIAGLRKDANEFRQVIRDAVAKSVNKEKKFVPLTLLGDEPAHDPLTATRMGSYYNLMIPYVLGSGILGDEYDGWIIDYLRNHGGLAMGMIRSTPHQGEFDNMPGTNPLYGLRYTLCLLKRGDRDHALAGFYGHLAQGMTRDTFIGGEGNRFFHGDKQGRSFYLPPNSASNAAWLITLRNLLVQDWVNDEGVPDTLRLCDAIPPRWLEDGKTLKVEAAPTAFGPVSFTIESKLKAGEIVATVTAPERKPAKWTLGMPEPPGHSIVGVTLGERFLPRDAAGRVDLTGMTDIVNIRYSVKPK